MTTRRCPQAAPPAVAPSPRHHPVAPKVIHHRRLPRRRLTPDDVDDAVDPHRRARQIVTMILRRAEGAVVRGERGMRIVLLLTQVNPNMVGKLRKKDSKRGTGRKRLASVLLKMRREMFRK